MGSIFTVTSNGDFRHTRRLLKRAAKAVDDKYVMTLLEEAGEAGVEALKASTPRDTGRTAEAWFYRIEKNGDGTWSVTFCNDRTSDDNKYVYIAHILEYGHFKRIGPRVRQANGRLTRGRRVWQPGIDYINPALDPVFKAMADKAWRTVSRVFEIHTPGGDVIELDEK